MPSPVPVTRLRTILKKHYVKPIDGMRGEIVNQDTLFAGSIRDIYSVSEEELRESKLQDDTMHLPLGLIEKAGHRTRIRQLDKLIGHVGREGKALELVSPEHRELAKSPTTIDSNKLSLEQTWGTSEDSVGPGLEAQRLALLQALDRNGDLEITEREFNRLSREFARLQKRASRGKKIGRRFWRARSATFLSISKDNDFTGLRFAGFVPGGTDAKRVQATQLVLAELGELLDFAEGAGFRISLS